MLEICHPNVYGTLHEPSWAMVTVSGSPRYIRVFGKVEEGGSA